MTVATFRPLLLLAALLLAAGLLGCGFGGTIGGSGGGAAGGVVLSGTVTAPAVAAAGVLPARRRGLAPALAYANDEDVLAALAASATCQVNGLAVAFRLSTATRQLTVSGLAASNLYDLRLSLGNLILRAYIPYNGETTSLPAGLDLATTAESLLIERYGLSIRQILYGEIDATLRDRLATRYLGLLQAATASSVIIAGEMTTELASIAAHIPIASAVRDLTPAFDVSGTWRGQGSYYLLDAASGKRVLRLVVGLSMKLRMSGRRVSGELRRSVQETQRVGLGTSVSDPEVTTVAGMVEGDKLRFTVAERELWTFRLLPDGSLLGGVATPVGATAFGRESDGEAFPLVK